MTLFIRKSNCLQQKKCKENILIISRNFKISFLLFFVLLLSIIGYSQKKWSLTDCINYAIENNIEIKQSEINTATNKINLQQSKLDLIPSLNASASHSYGWGRSIDMATYTYTNKTTQQNYFQISSNVTVFNGLQKYNTIKQNNFDYLASQFDSDMMRDNISVRLSYAYLQILYSQEILDVAVNQVDITNQQIERTQKLVNAGTLAKGSLLEIQSQGAQEEVNVIMARNNLNLAYLDLLQLLDLPASEKFDIVKPELNITEEPQLLKPQEVFSYAVMNRPQIMSAEYRVKSSDRGLAIAKGLRSPSVRLNGGWNTNYSDQITNQTGSAISFSDQFKDNQNKTLSLSLNIPIFNSYNASSSISRAKLNTKYAENNLELEKNTLRKTIEQAYNDATSAYKSYNATIKSVKSFQEAFKYTEQKFNVGMVNAVDYNLSKSRLVKAESELLQAKYDFVFKRKILDFYMGIPLEFLKK
ncbi:MAG: TolC family protein [Bacteroidales bacterium]|nr:TolC family protein [Bacteroidales bacterium]